MFRSFCSVLIALIFFSTPLKFETRKDGVWFAETTAHASARSKEADVNRISYWKLSDRIPSSGIKLNKTAKTVLEVVLNEMAGSALVGRRGAAQDALYIASVIANRANS